MSKPAKWTPNAQAVQACVAKLVAAVTQAFNTSLCVCGYAELKPVTKLTQFGYNGLGHDYEAGDERVAGLFNALNDALGAAAAQGGNGNKSVIASWPCPGGPLTPCPMDDVCVPCDMGVGKSMDLGHWPHVHWTRPQTSNISFTLCASMHLYQQLFVGRCVADSCVLVRSSLSPARHELATAWADVALGDGRYRDDFWLEAHLRHFERGLSLREQNEMLRPALGPPALGAGCPECGADCGGACHE